MLEAKEARKDDSQVHEQLDDAAPDTSRPLVSDRTTDNMSDFGAQRAQRGADQSVIQDDEDFSDSDDNTANMNGTK